MTKINTNATINFKREYEATYVVFRRDPKADEHALVNNGPARIALDTGDYVWVHASYSEELPEGAVQVGSGKDNGYDRHGNRIVAVPVALVKRWLTDEEAMPYWMHDDRAPCGAQP